MTEAFEVFVEDLRDKKKLRTRGIPAKRTHTKDIFVGLGDRRKDPSRRSSRVIIIVPPHNSSITITCTEAAVTSDPANTRMSKRELEQEAKERRKQIREIRKWLKGAGFIKYKKGAGKK